MNIEAFSDDGYKLIIAQDIDNPELCHVEIRHEKLGTVVSFTVPTSEILD